MKLAIPSTDDRGLDSMVEEHFGRARYYTLVEMESMHVESVEVPFESHGPGDLPAFLKEHGVELVIAYGIGGRAIQFFEEMGIGVITGAQGRIGDVIKAYAHARLATDKDWKDRGDFGEHMH